jgi:hypothetical protein
MPAHGIERHAALGRLIVARQGAKTLRKGMEGKEEKKEKEGKDREG